MSKKWLHVLVTEIKPKKDMELLRSVWGADKVLAKGQRYKMRHKVNRYNLLIVPTKELWASMVGWLETGHAKYRIKLVPSIANLGHRLSKHTSCTYKNDLPTAAPSSCLPRTPSLPPSTSLTYQLPHTGMRPSGLLPWAYLNAWDAGWPWQRNEEEMPMRLSSLTQRVTCHGCIRYWT